MARLGNVKLVLDCQTCKEKIRLSLYFGEKKIWNNTTSPTLQKLKAHQGHRLGAKCHFTPW